MMKVLLIVSGSIAIKKTSELLNLLNKEKINIDCIVTKSGIALIKSLKIPTFKNCEVYTDKDFFNKDNMNKLTFAKATTVNEIKKENFIVGFLSSIRQKMEAKKK